MKRILVSLTLVVMVSMVSLPAVAATHAKTAAKPAAHMKASASAKKSGTAHAMATSTVRGVVLALRQPMQESPAQFTLVAGKTKYTITVPSALFAGKNGLKLANGEKVSVTGWKHQMKTGVMIVAHAVTVNGKTYSLPTSVMTHSKTAHSKTTSMAKTSSKKK